jgi:DNA-binding XRE family transcriptional regulator
MTVSPEPMSPKEIKAFRATYRMSQGELALVLGVGPRTIQEWEGGRNHPPGYLRLALDAYGRATRGYIDYQGAIVTLANLMAYIVTGGAIERREAGEILMEAGLLARPEIEEDFAPYSPTLPGSVILKLATMHYEAVPVDA